MLDKGGLGGSGLQPQPEIRLFMADALGLLQPNFSWSNVQKSLKKIKDFPGFMAEMMKLLASAYALGELKGYLMKLSAAGKMKTKPL